MKGRTTARSSAATGPDGADAMGRSNRPSNALAPPSMPGFTKSAMDHSSRRRFSTGVPDSARRTEARTFLAANVVAASGFLMFCASSATTARKSIRAILSMSRRRSAYVVTTTSLAAIASSSRPAP